MIFSSENFSSNILNSSFSASLSQLLSKFVSEKGEVEGEGSALQAGFGVCNVRGNPPTVFGNEKGPSRATIFLVLICTLDTCSRVASNESRLSIVVCWSKEEEHSLLESSFGLSFP